MIEQYLEGRKTKKREAKAETKLNDRIKERLDATDFKKQFQPFKDKLKEVSLEQWESLPDAPDLVKISRKRRNQEYQRYTPVPDSILKEASLNAAGMSLQLDAQIVEDEPLANALDFAGGNGVTKDAAKLKSLEELGHARGHILSMQIDQAQDEMSSTLFEANADQVNREGYIQALSR